MRQRHRCFCLQEWILPHLQLHVLPPLPLQLPELPFLSLHLQRLQHRLLPQHLGLLPLHPRQLLPLLPLRIGSVLPRLHLLQLRFWRKLLPLFLQLLPLLFELQLRDLQCGVLPDQWGVSARYHNYPQLQYLQ